MKQLFISMFFLTFIFFSNKIKAQTGATEKRNKAIFVEAYGQGLHGSLNYDLRFKKGVQDGIGFRIGIGGVLSGFAPTISQGGSSMAYGVLALPVGVNYLIGKKRSAFETGLGLMPYSSTGGPYLFYEQRAVDQNGKGINAFMNLGYRLHPLNNGFIFRFSWTPSVNSRGIFPVGFGISAGYGFK